LVLAGVVCGPGIQPQGAVVSDQAAVTMTLSNAGTATVAAYVQRVGSVARFNGRITIGASLPTGTITVNLPSGYTIDSPSAGDIGHADGISGTAAHLAVVLKASSTSVVFYGDDGSGPWTATVPITWANGDIIGFNFTVPIAEWAGSGTVNVVQNDVEYASNSSTTEGNDTTSFAYGSNGSLVPTIAASTGTTLYVKRVRFPTAIQPTDQVTLEFQQAGVGLWKAIGDCGLQAVPLTQMNGTRYGAGMANVSGSSTDVDVYFADGGCIPSGATIGSAGSNWPANASDRWRLKKVAGGTAVGFGAATSTAAGLISREIAKTSFTATPTASSNLDAITHGSAFYTQLGRTVFVWGYVNADPTAASEFQATLTIPITRSSNFSGAWEAHGVLARGTKVGVILADTTSANKVNIWCTGNSTSSEAYYYHYSYSLD
jgi:hypothetical protein